MHILQKFQNGEKNCAPTSSKAHNESTTGLIFLLLYRFRSLSITPLIRPPRFCLKSRFNRENPAMTLFSSYSLIGFTFSTCHHWKAINSRIRKTFFKKRTGKFTRKMSGQVWYTTHLSNLKQQPRAAVRILFKEEVKKYAADWHVEIKHRLLLHEIRVLEAQWTDLALGHGSRSKELGPPSLLLLSFFVISREPCKLPKRSQATLDYYSSFRNKKTMHCISVSIYYPPIMFVVFEQVS